LKLFAQLLALILLAQTIFAQTNKNEDTLKTYYLDPIIVTGTRTEVLRKNIPLSVSVISEKDIKKIGDPSVLSLISDRVPGVFVSKRNLLGFGLAQGSAGQIYIRGTGGNPNTQVLILLDGRPQFMGLMGHPLPDNYISSNVEKIEIVRGPCSFLYGSNAMGGVVNIITKRQESDGFSVNINQSYGSFSTLIGDAGIGFKSGKIDLYVSVANQQSNGYRPYSEFKLNNGFTKAGYTINKNFSFNIDANLTNFKTYDPGTVSKPFVNNWVDILRGYAGFSFENKFEKTDGAVKFIYNYGKHKIYDGYRSEDRNVSILVYQSARFFKNNIISLGLDYKNYGGKANNIITNMDWGKHFVNEFGSYLQMQQSLLKRIALNGGIRFELNSVFGNEVVPQFGASVQLHKTTTLRATVSRGFRSPTIREMHLFPAPNSDLKPERMWNYEFGLIFNPISNLGFEASAFVNKGENIILTEGVYPNLKLTNSGNFTKKGVEVSVNYIPLENLSFNSNYSYLDPDMQTFSTPWHKFFIESSFRYKFVGLNLNVGHISKIYGDNYSRKRLTDYTLFNAKLLFYPANGLTFFIKGENLLNKEYQTIYGYPMPKATFSAGLNYNY
jgi:iron complex outermembrane receptor protein